MCRCMHVGFMYIKTFVSSTFPSLLLFRLIPHFLPTPLFLLLPLLSVCLSPFPLSLSLNCHFRIFYQQIKYDIGVKDSEINTLKDAVQSEKIKTIRLEKLLKKYDSKHSVQLSTENNCYNNNNQNSSQNNNQNNNQNSNNNAPTIPFSTFNTANNAPLRNKTQTTHTKSYNNFLTK